MYMNIYVNRSIFMFISARRAAHLLDCLLGAHGFPWVSDTVRPPLRSRSFTLVYVVYLVIFDSFILKYG